jgi:hypothetical protein
VGNARPQPPPELPPAVNFTLPEGTTPPSQNPDSLLVQAEAVEEFIKSYAADPRALATLTGRLSPDSVSFNRVIEQAVTREAATHPREVVEGLDKLNASWERERLTKEALASWSEFDPVAAFHWAAQHGPAAGMEAVALPFWKHDSVAAMTALDGLDLERQVNFIKPVALSNEKLSATELGHFQDLLDHQPKKENYPAKDVVTLVAATRAIADVQAVETWLKENSSFQNQILPELALGHGHGDWLKANRWLANFLDERLYTERMPSGALEFWTAWCQSEPESFYHYMDNAPEEQQESLARAVKDAENWNNIRHAKFPVQQLSNLGWQRQIRGGRLSK